MCRDEVVLDADAVAVAVADGGNRGPMPPARQSMRGGREMGQTAGQCAQCALGLTISIQIFALWRAGWLAQRPEAADEPKADDVDAVRVVKNFVILRLSGAFVALCLCVCEAVLDELYRFRHYNTILYVELINIHANREITI